MKRMPSVVFFFILLLMSVLSCVKEDRESCPCRLMLDLSGIDTSVVKVLNIQAFNSDGVVFSDTLSIEDFDCIYVREVPRDDMRLTLWGGCNAHEDLHIPYGMECPPLYMSSFDADARGETVFRKVVLLKNHCNLTVLFEGREQMPYSLTFRGNVDGYDNDGSPSAGEFSCVAYPSQTDASRVILPRQTDDSLLLDVEDMESSVLKTFAIGKYLTASGYDWTEDNLEDATVILDYHVTGITITYKGWDEEYTYDIIL